ncbi:hypothetical protein WICPIJ_001651 [Wickerhamomyces pijperi]|uniref:Uncharacterized protein n=1 Tax=Wickerhamomyces pijperi TaxID=599730 RepID=A0A9P8QD87_WICPI|nr:hypothetical protein WICPIJ_001651 [Wickerhamomyces pijperi]
MFKLNVPNLSCPKESAPHCCTIAVGWKLVITGSITALNNLTYDSSSIPSFKGTLREKCFPLPIPTSSKFPVPGKNNPLYLWNETVITRSVV